MIYAFGEYELDTRLCELRRDGEPHHVEPQVFDVLAHLVEHRDRLVTREELLDEVWGHRFVSSSTLSTRIKLARQAVGDDGRAQRVIQTVRGRGFRFVAEVETRGAPADDADGGRTDPSAAAAAITTSSPADPPAKSAGGVAGTMTAASTDAAAPVADPPMVAGRRSVPELIGREAEIDRLRECFRAARDGTRQLVFVTGEPGLGKTALVETLLADVRAGSDVRVGWGQCLDQRGAGEPYMPVLEAFGRLCRASGGDTLVDLLARHAPTWLVQMPSLLDADLLEDVQRRAFGATRERMLREMVEAIEVLTAETPLVLLLEDLHWSDPSTIDLIAWLGRRPEPARVLLLGTYRPGEGDADLHGVMRELRRDDRCTRLELRAWDEDGIGDYLHARFPSADLPAGLGRLIIDRTGGNPLFARSLIDAWLEKGALAETDGDWRIEGGLDGLARGIPDTLRGALEQQVERLSPEERTTLEVASVAGTEFSIAAIAAAVESADEEDVEERCTELARRGRLLRPHSHGEWPDGSVTARFAFSHQLYQEVLYERIPVARRRRLHRRIGDRLEAGYGDEAADRAGELAAHFRRGGDDERTVRYSAFAARQALRRNAHGEAIGHLNVALGVLRRRPDLPDAAASELELQRMLGPALLVTRGWGDPDAEKAYARARELSEQLEDSGQLARILYGLAYLHEIRGEYLQSHALIEQRLAMELPEQKPESMLEAHELLSCSLFHQGEFDDALEHARRGLSFLTGPEHHDAFQASVGLNAAMTCRFWVALAHWFLGQPDQAVERAAEALEFANRSDLTYVLAMAQVQTARLFQHRREERRVGEHAEAAFSLAEEHGYPYQRAFARTLGGWADVMLGSVDRGLAAIRQGLETQAAIGAAMERPYCLGLLAEALGRADRPEEGIDAVESALEAIRANARSFFWEAELRRLRGTLALQGGDETAAEAALTDALDIARRQGTPALELRTAVSLGRLWQRRDRGAEARELVGAIYEAFTEGFDTPDMTDARSIIDGEA